jgi:hypothetical protein
MFDIKKAQADLIAMRVKFGADSPKGRACYALIEQLQNLEGATGKQKENLHKLIRQSIARLNSDPQ